MANNKNKKKLKPEHKAIIIKMLGAFYKSKEIIDYLKKDYGVKITLANVNYYKNHKRDDIREARKIFLKDIEILPVSDKAYRILIRQKLVDELIKEKNLWSKHYSVTTGNVTYQTPNHLIVNKILDSVRDELEPKGSSPTDSNEKEDLLAKYIQQGEELAKKYSINRN